VTARFYEIPRRLAHSFQTAGPVHECVSGGYCYCVRMILSEDSSAAGFIIEQRLAERTAPTAEGAGIVFAVPVQRDARAEETFIFVESLTDAIEYIQRQNSEVS
jgi:hypothetical protein